MRKLILLVAINILLPFTVAAQTTRKKNQIVKNWLGKWERVSRMDDGTLEIKSINKNFLQFEMFVNSGGHTGEIEGKAFIKQNTAVYTAHKLGPCKLTFHLAGTSSINISQDGCDRYGGMGTYFGGEFLNVKHIPKQAPATLANLHILTLQQDAAFRKLADTSYQHFIDCTQLTSTDVKNLDTFNAQVITSGVRGLFTIMEYIIMVDKENHIWAALINNEKVYYFTNSDTYRMALPKTIEEWRSRFKDYRVIYTLPK